MKKIRYIFTIGLMILVSIPVSVYAIDSSITNETFESIIDSQKRSTISVPFNTTNGGYYSSKPSGTDVNLVQNNITYQEEIFKQLEAVTKSIELSTIVTATKKRKLTVTLNGIVDFSNYLPATEYIQTFYLNFGIPSYSGNVKVNPTPYAKGTKILTFDNQKIEMELPTKKADGSSVTDYQIVYDFFTNNTNHMKFKSIYTNLKEASSAQIETQEYTLIKGNTWTLDNSIVTFTDAAGNVFDSKSIDEDSFESNITVLNHPDTEKIGQYTVGYQYIDDFDNVINQTSIVNVINPQITVRFVNQDGNSLKPDEIHSDEIGKPYEISAKEITGHTLINIIGEQVGYYSNEEKIVTYVYKENTYTVDFNTNGGNSIESQKVSYFSNVKQPENPHYDGKIFKGWYMDENLTIPYDFNEVIVADTSIYAKWQSGMYMPDNTIVDTSGDMLRIQYISDFNFGNIENTIKTFDINALPDQISNQQVTPFISIIDDRPESQVSPWQLTAEISEFITKSNSSKLKNSKLMLSNINVLGNNNENLTVKSNSPISLKSGDITLICKSENPTPFSSYSLIFGNIDSSNRTSGVVLEVPGGSAKEVNSNYSSTIEWTITTGDIAE